jgi:hypothetical protein
MQQIDIQPFEFSVIHYFILSGAFVNMRAQPQAPPSSSRLSAISHGLSDTPRGGTRLLRHNLSNLQRVFIVSEGLKDRLSRYRIS